VVDEENEVVAVEPGSAAAQSGRQVGDRLDKLDGLAFQEKAAIKRKVSAQAGGNALRLTITRRDQAITLDILPAPPAPRPNAPTATPVLTPLEYY
jgi:C-terminal processing protease CtpA/Prc